MKRFVYTLILCMLPTVAPGEEVIDLPETSNNWFLTAVYSSLDNPTARDQELRSILINDVRLFRLVQQVTFTEWDDNSEFVRQSAWSSYLGTNRPAILLQSPANENGIGSVVYFASGPHLKTNEHLATSIASAVKNYRLGNACPRRPTPPPQQPVQPAVRPQIPQTVPTITIPEQQPAKEETPLLFIILPSILGAGFAIFQAMRKESAV